MTVPENSGTVHKFGMSSQASASPPSSQFTAWLCSIAMTTPSMHVGLCARTMLANSLAVNMSLRGLWVQDIFKRPRGELHNGVSAMKLLGLEGSARTYAVQASEV